MISSLTADIPFHTARGSKPLRGQIELDKFGAITIKAQSTATARELINLLASGGAIEISLAYTPATERETP